MNKKLKLKRFIPINQHILSISLLSLSTAIFLPPPNSNAQPLPKKSPIPQPINTTSAPIARLDNWRFYPQATQLEFNLSAGANPRYFYLSQPPRIVIDLPDTKLGYVPTQQNYPGAIQRIRVSQLNANVTRIVLDIAPGNFFDPNQLQLQPFARNNPTRWVLSPLTRSYGNSPPPVNYRPIPNNYPPLPNNLPPNPSYPQLPSSPPPTIINPQQPFVIVPPLTPNDSSPQPSTILPPPIFSNQPSNLNSPNFSPPPVPNNPPNLPSTSIIEFGQPIPNR